MTKIDWTKPLEIHLAYNHTWVPCKVIYKYEALGHWTYIVSYDWGGFERVSHFDEDTGGVRNKPVPMVEKKSYLALIRSVHDDSVFTVNFNLEVSRDNYVKSIHKPDYILLDVGEYTFKYPDPKEG